MELPQPLSRLVDATLEATVVASFTDVGITVRRHLTGWEDLDALDATGRVVLVTGATSGLGLETARQLARMGASVRLVGRDPAKTTAARADVESAAPGADVATYLADLANLADWCEFLHPWLDVQHRRAVDRIKPAHRQHAPLHFLYCPPR